jgi:hypothetical protein
MRSVVWTQPTKVSAPLPLPQFASEGYLFWGSHVLIDAHTHAALVWGSATSATNPCQLISRLIGHVMRIPFHLNLLIKPLTGGCRPYLLSPGAGFEETIFVLYILEVHALCCVIYNVYYSQLVGWNQLWKSCLMQLLMAKNNRNTLRLSQEQMEEKDVIFQLLSVCARAVSLRAIEKVHTSW